MTPKRRPLAVAMTLVLSAALAACTPPDVPQADVGPRTITILTHPRLAPYTTALYVAQDLGYFEESDIQAFVRPGLDGPSNHSLVSARLDDFAVTDFASLAKLVSDSPSIPPPIMVTALSSKPLVAYATLDSTIALPRDLAGRDIGVSWSDADSTVWPTYAHLLDIPPGDPQLVPAESQLSALTRRQVDAIGAYVTALPALRAAVAPRHLYVHTVAEYAPLLLGPCLVAARPLVNEDPDLVEQVARAVVRGLLWSVDHPSEAASIAKRYNPSTDAAVAQRELQELAPYLLRLDDGKPTLVRVMVALDYLKRSFVIRPDVAAQDVAAITPD